MTQDSNVAYKFKTSDGRWSPLLHFVKETATGYLIFKPVEDTKSTAKVDVVEIYVGVADMPMKVYNLCKFYGSWELAPHTCGNDCPLEMPRC